MKYPPFLLAMLVGLSVSAGDLDAWLSFSSDGGKTYYDEPPELKVGSRLLVKAKWQPAPRDAETLTVALLGLQSDFASANRGRQHEDGRAVWAQRLPKHWFGSTSPGSCVHELDFSARPAGIGGCDNVWDGAAKKYVSGPLPACPALAPGSYMFQLRFHYWLKGHKQLATIDFPFIVKIVAGEPAKPVAAVQAATRVEEWLPALAGDYMLPVSKCQALYGAAKPRLSGQFLMGGSDCGWEVEGVKEGEYYVRLLLADGGLGGQTFAFAYLNGVPVSFDHASGSGYFQKNWFSVVESRKPLWIKNGDVLRLNPARRAFVGGAAFSRTKMDFAPVLVAPLSLGWLHDRFKVEASLTPDGRLAVAVANRSGSQDSYKIGCKVLDYFQNQVAEFTAAPTLADGDSFRREMQVKLHATDRCRAVVTVEDGGGFRTETVVEALRDDCESFRRKMWLNQGWQLTGVADDGTAATRSLQGIESLKVGAKWVAVELPASGLRPVLGNNEHLAWFKKTFAIPSELAGGRLFVHFTRACYDCRVFLNGRQVAERGLGDASFDVELTGACDLKGENTLVVELRDEVAGLTPEGLAEKTLNLSSTAKMKAPLPGRRVGLGEAWIFSAPEHMLGEVSLRSSYRNKRLDVSVEIPEGSFVPGSTLSAHVSLAGRELLSLPAVKLDSPGVKALAAKWDDPPLWGPETFPLLRLTTELRGGDGTLLDSVDTRFGFREFWAEGMDLKWNGVKVNFASRAWLNTWGGDSMQAGVRAKTRENIRMARRNGCDMLRHIYAPEYYADIADEEGMPFAQGGTNTFSHPTKQQLDSDEFWTNVADIGAGVVKSLRNHPSVVEWYLSNEYFGESEKRNGERLRAYGEKIAAADPTRIREFGCDLDLHGSTPVVSTHYPVDLSALREAGAYLPESFYWRRFDHPLVPGMHVPAGMVKNVANVFAESPIEWGRKPIIINECCWITMFLPPDGFSRLVGDEVYRGMAALDAAHRLAMKLASRGHRDAQVSAITLWSWIGSDPNSYALPAVDVNILQRWNKFRSGAKVIYDVNLTRDLRDAKTLDFHWELRGSSGEVIDSQNKSLAFSPCELKREHIVLKLPEVGEESVFSLVAELKDGGVTCAGQTFPLRLYPAVTGGVLGLFGSDAANVQAKVKVGLYDPAGASAARLRAIFDGLEQVESTSVASLAGLGLLIVGENQSPEVLAGLGEPLKTFVRGGGTVLLLRQGSAPSFLPVPLTLSNLATSTNFSYRPGHPLMDGVVPDELDYWWPRHKTGSEYYFKPAGGNARVVVESGGPRGMEYAGLVEMPYGKGSFVCTQFDLLEDYAENPVAWKLMRNIAAFASAPKNACGSVASIGPRAQGLETLGAKLDPIASPDALANYRSAILNAADGVEPRFVEPLKRFVSEGGKLLVLGAGEESSAALSELCGKSLKFRGAAPPSWAGRAVVCRRGVLTEGLNNYDLFWKDRPETENCGPCFNSEKTMQAPLGAMTVEAEGVAPLLYPSFLLEVERGEGLVLFCNLNLSTKERSVKSHVVSLASTLLTNLGVELQVAGEPSIPKGLAYIPVDISKALNRSFVDEVAEDGKGGWSDQGPEADLRSFPMDKPVQTLNGVPFRIERPKSCLVLSSRFSRGGVDRAELPVGMRADALFFLQSSAWTSDAHHASYVVNYGDGSSAEIRLVGRVNLRDWAAVKPQEAFTGEDGTFTSCAWTGAGAKFGKCSLFMMAWPNPHPEKLISSITAVSMKQGVPILVAVTVGTCGGGGGNAASGQEARDKAGRLLTDADALFKEGKFAAAEKLYLASVAAAWETRDAYLGLGYARERLGRSAEAIEAYERLIAIEPKLFEPYKCVGRCYESDGDFGKALETYRRSLAMDPNQPDVMAALEHAKKKLEEQKK